MPTELRRVMVSIRDESVAPTIGVKELNGLSVAGALLRYSQLVERGAAELRPVLSRAEWNAIADANNGCADIHDYIDGPMLSALGLILANVQDSIGLGEKWSIDAKELCAKLSELAPHHGEAILAAVRWFWEHCEEGQIDHTEDEWWTPNFRRGERPTSGKKTPKKK